MSTAGQAYSVLVRDTYTGVERLFAQDWMHDVTNLDPHDGTIWQWTEGNFSCDCNRGAFFAAVGNEDDPDASCCGERYRIRLTLADGTVLIDELTTEAS